MTSSLIKMLFMALIVAALFFVVSMPQVYGLTNSVFSLVGLKTIDGNQPTTFGVILHGIVLYVLTVLISKFLDPKEKFYRSIKRSI